MNPLTQIPALYRKYVYFAFALAGVVVGALEVALGGSSEPEWLAAVVRVLAYLGVALGLTAGSNVTSVDGPEPSPTTPPVE